VRRLQYFTKGFYSVTERDGDVVITDLRMGQAQYYVFAYRVGERADGNTRPHPDRRYRYPTPDIPTGSTSITARAGTQPSCSTAAPRRRADRVHGLAVTRASP